MFQERVVMKSSADISSPRHPGTQGRPSGRMSPFLLFFSDCFQVHVNILGLTLSSPQSAASFRLVSRQDSSSRTCQILHAPLLLNPFFLLKRLLRPLNPHDSLSGRGKGPHPSCSPFDPQSCPSGQLERADWAGPFLSKRRSLRERSVHHQQFTITTDLNTQ